MDRTTKLIVTAVVVFGGVGMLVYSSMADAEFYKHVHEVTAEPEAWADKTLKVHGYVEAGSIETNIVEQSTKRTFVLQYPCPDDDEEQVKGCQPGVVKRIRVRHTGPAPDTFKDLAEVVAKGQLVEEDGSYVLHAEELMAKCPSKYEENQRPSEYGKQPQGQASSGSY